MWLRVLVVVLALCGAARAQSFSVGAQTGITVNFGLPSTFSIVLTGELRRLVGGFGVRTTLGVSHNFEFAADALYRFDDSPQGLLYMGGGLGLANVPLRTKAGMGFFQWDGELRGVIGYEWIVATNLRLCLEGVVRFPFSSDGRFGLMFGIVWLWGS
jgi:hypothetical protein